MIRRCSRSVDPDTAADAADAAGNADDAAAAAAAAVAAAAEAGEAMITVGQVIFSGHQS